MARDRTARTRIRQHLAAAGPVGDPSGHATGVLMEAIDYQGSPVAFIQLIAAMDRDGEIVREIKGKRTYRISISEEALATMTPAPATYGGQALAIDYDQLARAVVREFMRTLRTPAPVLAQAPAEMSEGAQRQEYAKRLERARQELDLLLQDVAQDETVSAG